MADYCAKSLGLAMEKRDAEEGAAEILLGDFGLKREAGATLMTTFRTEVQSIHALFQATNWLARRHSSARSR